MPRGTFRMRAIWVQGILSVVPSPKPFTGGSPNVHCLWTVRRGLWSRLPAGWFVRIRPSRDCCAGNGGGWESCDEGADLRRLLGRRPPALCRLRRPPRSSTTAASAAWMMPCPARDASRDLLRVMRGRARRDTADFDSGYKSLSAASAGRPFGRAAMLTRRRYLPAFLRRLSSFFSFGVLVGGFLTFFFASLLLLMARHGNRSAAPHRHLARPETTVMLYG